MDRTQLKLNSFLYFGYSLEYENKNYDVDFSNINRDKYQGADEVELIAEGGRIFREVMQKMYRSEKKNVIPLSGGMDSRAILAMLMELTDAASIYTYTFGTPKTYDFDIGNKIASEYKTRHTSYDLTKYTYQQDELINIAGRIDYQSPLFLHAPVWDLDKRFSDGIIWSGANAGAVVGSFYKEDSAKTYKEAQERFIHKARFTKSKNIINCNPLEFVELMKKDHFSKEELTFDEQVFFQERSIKHLAPHVLMAGFDYLLPFVNTAFMDFMLSVPNHYRYKKNLYKKIMTATFPDIFKLESESNLGLRMDANKFDIFVRKFELKVKSKVRKKFPGINLSPAPTLNYLDWDWAFRKKKDVRSLAEVHLKDLESRKLLDWLDIKNIWNSHKKRKDNYSDVLMVLISLELFLKNGYEI